MSRSIDWTPLRVAVGILKFHDIPMIVTGEAAFAYYNALRFDYEDEKFPAYSRPSLLLPMNMEIVISDESFPYAPGLLCASGLFTPALPQSMDGFDGGWRFQCDFPYLAPGAWAGEASKSMVILIPAERAGINPETERCDTRGLAPGLDLDGLTEEDAAYLPLPHLVNLMWSLLHRDEELKKMYYGKSVLRIFTKCLVDGMDLTTEWAYKHFGIADAGYSKLIRHLVITKGERHNFIDPRTWAPRGKLDPQAARLIRSHPGRG